MDKIKKLKKLVNIAYKKNEIPVASIILKDNKILSFAYNTRNKTHRIIDHAEIKSILKANKKVHDWRLNDCEMITSMKPCKMCEEVIKSSRLSKVKYILDNNENDSLCFEKIKVKSNEYEYFLNKMSLFFKNKR